MQRATRKKRSRIWLIPESEFRALVQSSTSYRSILVSLKVSAKGCNHYTLKRRIRELNVDDAHIRLRPVTFSAQAATTIPLDEILVEHSAYTTTTHLRHRLLKAGLLKNVCALCGQLPVWHGKPLVLHLDHANGVRHDNRLFNLRLVCPNCHSQTETYGGRNKSSRMV